METSKTFEIEIKELPEMHLVYYEFTGAYPAAMEKFEDLMKYLMANSIALGPHSMGIFYDDPAVVPENELRSEIGFLVNGPVEVSDGYKYKKIEACKAVCTKYTSMEEIMAAYGEISGYIVENKLDTAPYSMELYYGNDPNVIDAEIAFTIKK